MDHTADYPSFLMIGAGAGLGTLVDPSTGKVLVPPFKVYGPATRGPLEVNKTRYTGRIVYVDSANPTLEIPTPGMRQQTESTLESYAQAINDMTLDSGYRDYTSLVEVHEIGTGPGEPGDIQFHAEGLDLTNETCVAMDPFEVYSDENVRVTATLVDHHQVFPSLAYRFDTVDGSVVFSGDTGNNTRGNLQKLADGADILVHEVIDPAWIDQKFGNVTPGSPMDALKIHMLTSHTTIRDAGTVATECNVKTLILNHIVPGNTPRSRLLQAQRTFSGRLIVGEDLMEIGVGRAEGSWAV
jgi:ribonuclease BN (tRNA processing enzyme)